MTDKPHETDLSKPYIRALGLAKYIETQLVWEVVEDQTFVGEEIYLDGRLFRRCVFRDCLLISALGLFQFEAVEFEEDCQVRFLGLADNIAALVQGASPTPPTAHD